MRTVITWISLMLTWMCLGASLQAQSQLDSGNGVGDVRLVWALPTGDFGEYFDDYGVGASVLIGGRVPGTPLVLGTEVGLLSYGTDNLLEFTGVGAPVALVNAQSNRNVYTAHLLARVTPQSGLLRPYADVLVGLSHFTSRVHVERDAAAEIVIGGVLIDDDLVSTNARFGDTAPSIGMGAGLDVRLVTQSTGWSDETATVVLSLGARYLVGLEAEYLRQDGVRDGSRIVIDAARTRTDMILPQVGLRVSM